jgi:hypothetical protein
MAEGLAAHEHPLSKVFCWDYQFEVPSYQRPYSWEEEQAGELFDDVLAAMRRTGERAGADPYFLGSLVLIKTPGSARAQVVDGQQRLTTLTLLFAALRDMIGREDVRTALEKLVVEPGDPLQNLVEQPRLTVWEAHREFFGKHVTHPGGLRALESEQALAGAQELVRLNGRLFIRRLEALPEEERIELARFLVSPDEGSAHRIFAVMNDRGMQLSHTDILKAEILGGIPAADREGYAANWATAEECVGREAFGDLFAHIRMIYAKAKPEKSILEEFRRQVLGTFAVSDYPQVITDLIEPYADAQAVLLTAGYKAQAHAEEVNRYLRWLGRLDNSDWQPAALWALRHWRNDPSRLAAFLGDLERLAASMFIRRADVNVRIRRYGEVLRALEVGSRLSDPGVLGLTEDEREETMNCLNGPVYETARTRLYILMRLDEALAGAGASYEHKILTVEHVLPQSPQPGSDWTVNFTEEERDYWLHRLANLVLLDRRKNSAAANLDFSDKKERYFATKGKVSPFALTTTVISRTQWTPDILSQRQEEHLASLATAWNL